jgi:hypothetical protein
VLGDATDLTRWWPQVYLAVTELDHGDDRGIGKRVRLLTKGRLPYRLRWEFVIIESRKPHGFTLVASGDFVGRGIWIFEPEDSGVVATYDWKISAEKGLLKHFSAIFKPVFSWNHHWAMARGEESLRSELQRRRAISGKPMPR